MGVLEVDAAQLIYLTSSSYYVQVRRAARSSCVWLLAALRRILFRVLQLRETTRGMRVREVEVGVCVRCRRAMALALWPTM
jgi:hypothetical protein